MVIQLLSLPSLPEKIVNKTNYLQHSFSTEAEDKHFSHEPPARVVLRGPGRYRAQHFPLQQGHAHQITHKWGTGWEAFHRPEGLEFTRISMVAYDDSGLIKLKVCYIAC